MKTGAQIVAELEHCFCNSFSIHEFVRKNMPTIKAALLAYAPKSALRTILDRAENARNGTLAPFMVTDSELAAARAELDELERS